jgi:hypothetical protein
MLPDLPVFSFNRVCMVMSSRHFDSQVFTTFAEFWPEYVRAHSRSQREWFIGLAHLVVNAY